MLAPFGAPRGRDPQRRTRGQSAPRAAEGPTADLGEERSADTSEGTFDIAHDERRFNAEHAIFRARERCISARVSAAATGVIRTIDLDHEALRRSVEVRDEAPEQRYLATKYYAELPPRECETKAVARRE